MLCDEIRRHSVASEISFLCSYCCRFQLMSAKINYFFCVLRKKAAQSIKINFVCLTTVFLLGHQLLHFTSHSCYISYQEVHFNGM
jgi:hypothetical protein